MNKHLAEIDLQSAGPWWEGRKFKHPETDNEVGFKSLPLEEQKKLNSYVREHAPEKVLKTLVGPPETEQLKKNVDPKKVVPEKPPEFKKEEPGIPQKEPSEKVPQKVPVEKVVPEPESERLKKDVDILKEKNKVEKLKKDIEKLKGDGVERKLKDKKKKIKDKQKKRKDQSKEKEEYDKLMDNLLDDVDDEKVNKGVLQSILDKVYEESPENALELMYFFEHLSD